MHVAPAGPCPRASLSHSATSAAPRVSGSLISCKRRRRGTRASPDRDRSSRSRGRRRPAESTSAQASPTASGTSVFGAVERDVECSRSRPARATMHAQPLRPDDRPRRRGSSCANARRAIVPSDISSSVRDRRAVRARRPTRGSRRRDPPACARRARCTRSVHVALPNAMRAAGTRAGRRGTRRRPSAARAAA